MSQLSTDSPDTAQAAAGTSGEAGAAADSEVPEEGVTSDQVLHAQDESKAEGDRDEAE